MESQEVQEEALPLLLSQAHPLSLMSESTHLPFPIHLGDRKSLSLLIPLMIDFDQPLGLVFSL